MKTLHIPAWVFALLIALPSFSQKRWQLSSPGGNIKFSFTLHSGMAAYSISFKDRSVIEQSALGLHFEGIDFTSHLVSGKASFREGIEKYQLIVGKASQVESPYREMIIPLKETSGKLINFIVRAFEDGIAFRYEIPAQQNWSSYSLLDENTAFRLSGNPMVRALLLPGYTTSHEGEYTVVPFSDLKEDTLMDMPALFEYPGKIYLAITEATLVNYAGMYLSKHKGMLTVRLSPLPGQEAIKVKAHLPHRTPWRVLMISDRVGALIESNILTNLNEPCPIKDLSWIKPGKTTFPWWNGNVTPDTSWAPGNNFETNKYYIDFCARNGLQYHSVVEYGLHEWYMNDGANFQPGLHADVTTPVPGLNMKEVCDYAKSQGVGIRVWVHWAALYPKLDTAFAVFEKWGIEGMMVDFMDRDDQQMVNIQEEILRKAAQHHLHIQFHGAYKPTGMHRTYPNEYTREGTLNYEVNKWEKRITPAHDINIPFTRMLAGSTDYHLGGFRAVPESQFKVQYTRPLMLATRCHMLAMYVVLENYLGMVCDYPGAYEGEPGFDFIKQVPVVWDETKVPDAEPGEYIIVARRKGNDWYVGAITNEKARQINIPLSFLSGTQYAAITWSDAPDTSKDPNHLIQQHRTFINRDTLTLSLSAGGGAVIILKAL